MNIPRVNSGAHCVPSQNIDAPRVYPDARRIARPASFATSTLSLEWTDIYTLQDFVPKDFFGASASKDPESGKTTWTFVLESDAYPNLVEASKCLPISFIGIEDERRLLLNIKKIGWLRLTITLPPRRWQPTLRHPPVKIHPRQPRSFRLNKATARDGQRCPVGHTPEWRG